VTLDYTSEEKFVFKNPTMLELDPQNLFESFQRFGKVNSVYVLPSPNAHIAFVQMASIYEAYLALLYYDGREVARGQAVLRVKFVKKKVMTTEEVHKIQEVKKDRTENSLVFEREYRSLLLKR